MLNASESLQTGFFLTRKRPQVQTLSRPPPFSQVTAVSTPSRERSLHAWAALGPHAILAGKLGGPSGPSTAGARLRNNHAQ
jgi:hypothetical protein